IDTDIATKENWNNYSRVLKQGLFKIYNSTKDNEKIKDLDSK
ncbi:28740_t:CDS:2, partial [Gigaspora margarita]